MSETEPPAECPRDPGVSQSPAALPPSRTDSLLPPAVPNIIVQQPADEEEEAGRVYLDEGTDESGVDFSDLSDDEDSYQVPDTNDQLSIIPPGREKTGVARAGPEGSSPRALRASHDSSATPTLADRRSRSFSDLVDALPSQKGGEAARATAPTAPSASALPPQRKVPLSDYETFQWKLHERLCEILDLKTTSSPGPSTPGNSPAGPPAFPGALRDPQDLLLHRFERIKELFNDLTCKVNSNVLARLARGSRVPVPPRYYLMLASFYVQNPDAVTEVERRAVVVWSNPYFQMIYPMIFFQWLFQLCPDEDLTLKRVAVFLQGTNRVFWLDVEYSTLRFERLFQFLTSFVTDGSRWRGRILKRIPEVFDLVAKFFFYYNIGPTGPAPIFSDGAAGGLGATAVMKENVVVFLKQIQELFQAHATELQASLSTHRKLHALNMFVNEVVRMLSLVKNELALIKFISDCAIFQGELAVSGQKTRLRLYSVLLDLCTPGYPLYPTPDVKRTAKATIDTLFPGGRAWRSLIHFFFRFLRPLSFVTWFNTRKQQLLELWRSLVRKLVRVVSLGRWGRKAPTPVPQPARAYRRLAQEPPPSSPAPTHLVTSAASGHQFVSRRRPSSIGRPATIPTAIEPASSQPSNDYKPEKAEPVGWWAWTVRGTVGRVPILGSTVVRVLAPPPKPN